MSFADLITPGREYSELENRYLAKAPAFSLRSLFDNTYTMKIEEFTNDRFIARDAWITLKSICETALFKIENNGIIYGKDGYMFEKSLTYDAEQLQKNIDSIHYFADNFGGNITFAMIPSSDTVLSDKVPKGLQNVEQLPIIQSVYDQMGKKNIRTVDIYAALSASRLESTYIDPDFDSITTFYRTDHHWTTHGAHTAYTAYMKALGLDPTALEAIGRPYEVPGFYGTFYSKSKLWGTEPDIISYYDIPVKSVAINGEEKTGLYDLAKFGERDKYAAFLHGNNGVTVIESAATKEDGEKSRLLVFKDSYGNSLAPFLCYNFDEVTVADLRYLSGVKELMAAQDYDEILFLYSFSSFTSEASIVNLKL